MERRIRQRRNRSMRSRHRDYRNDHARDYRNDYRNDYRRDYRRDYADDYRDRMMDYNDDYSEMYRNDYDDYDEEYTRDLKKLIRKLQRKDKFKMQMEQVIELANKEGVSFDDVTEEEFYVIYLSMISDYEDITSDPIMFIRMAKDFIEDDDIAIDGSDKVYIYINEIILGK